MLMPALSALSGHSAKPVTAEGPQDSQAAQQQREEACSDYYSSDPDTPLESCLVLSTSYS